VQLRRRFDGSLGDARTEKAENKESRNFRPCFGRTAPAPQVSATAQTSMISRKKESFVSGLIATTMYATVFLAAATPGPQVSATVRFNRSKGGVRTKEALNGGSLVLRPCIGRTMPAPQVSAFTQYLLVNKIGRKAGKALFLSARHVRRQVPARRPSSKCTEADAYRGLHWNGLKGMQKISAPR
jgi:hypothetical protein